MFMRLSRRLKTQCRPRFKVKSCTDVYKSAENIIVGVWLLCALNVTQSSGVAAQQSQEIRAQLVNALLAVQRLRPATLLRLLSAYIS